MPILEVRNLSKRFDDTEVIKDISFSLEKGETLSVIGSSGSGKTTLLRCLNFLETPDTGTITVNGEVIFDAADPASRSEKGIREKRLHFGLVFQSFNLFPQYTALQNVTLAGLLLAKERPDYKTRKNEIREEIINNAKAILTVSGFHRDSIFIRTNWRAAARVAMAVRLLNPDIPASTSPRPPSTRAYRQYCVSRRREEDHHDNRDPRNVICAPGVRQRDVHG